MWCYLRLQVFFVLQLWCWGFDILIFQKYKINYEFIFGKYKPQLVHTLDQLKIASCSFLYSLLFSVVYTLVICALFYLWFYCSFTEVILSKFQMALICPVSFAFFCLCVLPVPGKVFFDSVLSLNSINPIDGICFDTV